MKLLFCNHKNNLLAQVSPHSLCIKWSNSELISMQLLCEVMFSSCMLRSEVNRKKMKLTLYSLVDEHTIPLEWWFLFNFYWDEILRRNQIHLNLYFVIAKLMKVRFNRFSSHLYRTRVHAMDVPELRIAQYGNVIRRILRINWIAVKFTLSKVLLHAWHSFTIIHRNDFDSEGKIMWQQLNFSLNYFQVASACEPLQFTCFQQF